MIGLGEKPVLSPQKCVELMKEEENKKILKKLMQSKKLPFSQRFRDPIISEVYVECEDDLNINRRSKTQKYIGKNSTQIRSLAKNQYPPKDRHLYSQSVELPYLLKLTSKKRHTNLGHHSEFSSNKGFDSEKSTNIKGKASSCFQSKQKLSQIVQKVYKDSQRSLRDDKQSKSLQRPKLCNKNAASKKMKLEKLRKPETPGENARRKWQEISFLKMDTYFAKVMQNKIKINEKYENNEKIIELKESKILQKVFVPKREDVPDFIKDYQPINTLIKVNQLVKQSNFQIMIDEDKDLYFGCIEQEKKTGLGVYVNKSYKLQGNWKDDQIIQGYQISSQGFYKGKFKANKRSGQGQFQWKNGESYDGEWKNGLRHGSGVWKSGNGDSYIGHWANGKVQGYGVHISANGQKYEGAFKNFLKHGRAKEIFPNGDMYEGDYRNGKPNGKGKYTWKNTIIYEGEFVEGYRHGKGIVKAPNGIKFEGNFTNQRPNGKGDLIYENGDSYTGEFKNGDKDGFGTMKLAYEHKIIVGKWKDNQFEK